ncbi:hypothetical protein PYW07_007035 [Mythimna separata]|uniref:Ricin B lectin domain-containing protein n=1 Tax=Mythimna separata TaxID=271217 RepID=A0AAD8E0A3_MYTSE|nr:hypothetical protein PYW07_007035 [Mythimna separata]
MKFLVVLAALVALCASSAIPIIPGDNSHYVEGESRYIWMPDGEGVPHLVDLQEPVDEAVLNSRNGANNQYWLFTRQNPTNAQIIVNVWVLTLLVTLVVKPVVVLLVLQVWTLQDPTGVETPML